MVETWSILMGRRLWFYERRIEAYHRWRPRCVWITEAFYWGA